MMEMQAPLNFGRFLISKKKKSKKGRHKSLFDLRKGPLSFYMGGGGEAMPPRRPATVTFSDS